MGTYCITVLTTEHAAPTYLAAIDGVVQSAGYFVVVVRAQRLDAAQTPHRLVDSFSVDPLGEGTGPGSRHLRTVSFTLPVVGATYRW